MYNGGDPIDVNTVLPFPTNNKANRKQKGQELAQVKQKRKKSRC